jgi:uncharacterized protein (TIGR03086 family)
MDMLEAYEDALASTGSVVKGIKRAQMGARTPCAAYDVRALLEHLIGGFGMWVDMAAGKKVSFGTTSSLGADASADYEAGAKAALKAFSGRGVLKRTFHLPNGADVPGEQALGIALMEAVVHGWDLAKATGQGASINEGLATMLMSSLEAIGVPRSADGNPFGEAVALPKTASAADKLVAFLGREP